MPFISFLGTFYQAEAIISIAILILQSLQNCLTVNLFSPTDPETRYLVDKLQDGGVVGRQNDS
jgi:hypothetical protein